MYSTQFRQLKDKLMETQMIHQKQKRQFYIQTGKLLFNFLIQKITYIDLSKKNKINPQVLLQQIIEIISMSEENHVYITLAQTYSKRNAKSLFAIEGQLFKYIQKRLKDGSASFLQTQQASSYFSNSMSIQNNKKQFSKQIINKNKSQQLNFKLQKSNYYGQKQQNSVISLLQQLNLSKIDQKNQNFDQKMNQIQKQAQKYISNIKNFNTEFNQFVQQLHIERKCDKLDVGLNKIAILRVKLKNSHTKFNEINLQKEAQGPNKKAAQQIANKLMLKQIFSEYPLIFLQYIQECKKKNLKSN